MVELNGLIILDIPILCALTGEKSCCCVGLLMLGNKLLGPPFLSESMLYMKKVVCEIGKYSVDTFIFYCCLLFLAKLFAVFGNTLYFYYY